MKHMLLKQGIRGIVYTINVLLVMQIPSTSRTKIVLFILATRWPHDSVLQLVLFYSQSWACYLNHVNLLN